MSEDVEMSLNDDDRAAMRERTTNVGDVDAELLARTKASFHDAYDRAERVLSGQLNPLAG